MTSVAPEAPTEAQLNADAPPDAPPTAAEPAPPAAAPPPPPAAAQAAAAPSVELEATGPHGQPGSIPHMSHKNSLARAFSASHAEHGKAGTASVRPLQENRGRPREPLRLKLCRGVQRGAGFVESNTLPPT